MKKGWLKNLIIALLSAVAGWLAKEPIESKIQQWQHPTEAVAPEVPQSDSTTVKN